MKTVYHPTLPVTQEVDDSAVNEWVDQGWRKTPPPDQEKATDEKKGEKA